MQIASASSKRLMTSNSISKQRSDVKESGPSTSNDDTALPPTPQVHVNGKPAITSNTPKRPKSSASSHAPEADGSGWGANFWVTLADPQSGVSFYACPATGEVSWDPPVGNFLLPPSPDGEWWEMTDESTGLSYYYHTKTGETVWERPQAFVIPLGVLQNTALTRRLSLNRNSMALQQPSSPPSDSPNSKPVYRRSRSYVNDTSSSSHSSLQPQQSQARQRTQSASRVTHSPNSSPTSSKSPRQTLRRSTSGEKYSSSTHHSPASSSISPLSYERGHPLAPIPGSPYNTDASPPGSPSKRSLSRASTSSKRSTKDKERTKDREKDRIPAKDANSVSRPATASKESPKRKSMAHTPVSDKDDGLTRSRSSKSTKSVKSSSFLPFHAPQPQSLNAALEKLAFSSAPTTPSKKDAKDLLNVGTDNRAPRHSTSLGRASGREAMKPRLSMDPSRVAPNSKGIAFPVSPNGGSSPATSLHSSSTGISPTSSSFNGRLKTPTSPSKTLPPVPPIASTESSTSQNGNSRQWMAGMTGKEISEPVFDLEATQNMSPVKMRNAGRPILVEQPVKDKENLSPWDSDLGIYAHRRKASLNTGTYPILPEDLASDIQQFSESQFARQYFSTHRTGFIFRRKVPVEQLMSWQKSPLNAPLLQMNKPLHKEAIRTFKSIQRVMGDRDRERPVHNGSTSSLVLGSALLEEERSLLAEGLHHGELRDEIYCQVMKQLNGNPNPESVFKGWQLICVLLVTFPPSKNFELSLRNFLHRATYQPEGRIDVMAKYCLRRLAYVSRKGPRGKAPTLAEIEAASDAAFHPSIFGESLDAIYRLQERNYPQQRVPIILPFLSDGILALGGMKSEGIFRVPGDGDAVSELKLRIDKGYYTLDGFDDPHVLASLLKLWLRELADPLIPDEMYNDCITDSQDPEACVQIVHRLPTINRRVVLFVVSFLQLFLDEKVQLVTKMTAPNLALVMAPNLLRCSSESMAVVFTNAQYEQTFVHNLLLHLKCDEVDTEYIPAHGHGAIPTPSPPVPLPKNKTSKARHRSTVADS